MNISSPIATGGGGAHFEQHVAAFALGLLLVRAIPPILTNTSVVEVHFQTRHLGWCTDDILLVGEISPGHTRKLAIQVKRTLRMSATDEDCRKTIQGMWDDFRAEDRFTSSTDRLAVIILHGTATLLQSFNSLLQCARATLDTEDFHNRLAHEGYVSKMAKKQHKTIQTILAEHTGGSVDGALYWRFLRTVNILSFDLNTSASQTEASMLSLLALAAVNAPNPSAIAGTTWAKLLECASEGQPIAKSYTRESLPQELREWHSTIPAVDSQKLLDLIDHGKTVRNRICSTIGHKYKIDRFTQITALLEKLAEHQVVIISGTAGSGKSALAKNLLDHLELDRPVLAFQAVEFTTTHINETLAKTQTELNAQALFALLAGHDQTLVLIESVERLLEHMTRDAFSDLLQLALKHRSIQLVFTCRDYSLETVQNALIAPIGMRCAIFEIPPLSDDELDQIHAKETNLAPPLENNRLRSLLRTPYILDIASRLNWTESILPESARTFREKCWRELIRADHFALGGMPQRREKIFVHIAHQRATKLRPFVSISIPDDAALSALRQDSLVEASPDSSSLLAPAHDVLEDWAILHWLTDQFSIADDAEATLAECVGGYPALRRSFRLWLGEWFEIDSGAACEFVLGILERTDLPPYFRDDCLVSVLFAETASDFLERCRGRLVDNSASLCIQIIHILRTACKKSPHWIDVLGLPSQIMVPVGAGWAPTLRLVSNLIDELLPKYGRLVLALVEDWAKQIEWNNLTPAGFEAAGLIVDDLLSQFEGYHSRDERKRALEILLKIPQAVPQFGDLIERARMCNFKDQTASELSDLICRSLSSVYVCRYFPTKIISLVNTRLRISKANLDSEFRSSSFSDIEQFFGIRRYEVSNALPASALHGPYRYLLQAHPQEALAFIIDFLNHAGDWYGTQRWPSRPLEPAWQITVEIPDSGSVQQWMNERLYLMYRGMSVGPYALQSALMALEAWLLEIGKMDDVNLEQWLLHILLKSNNVMATSVVSSACIAYPEKAGRAGLALLSSRGLIQNDRIRMASEVSMHSDLFIGILPSHLIYEQERKKSNRLKHRREDLESLAIRMQCTDLRQNVWEIIDRHRSELREDQDEETLLWRLALHRMDVRGYKPIEPPEGSTEDDKKDVSGYVGLGPGEVEYDIQNVIDARTSSFAITDRHMSLLNRVTNAWKDRNSKETMEWKSLLSEAQTIERELDEPAEFCRDSSGLVAALCVRDHFDELDESEFLWCAKRIESEVLRDSDCPADYIRYARNGLKSDRACANVLSLLAVHQQTRKVFDALALLTLALTHPVDEVAVCANDGVGAFLGEEHKELILQCAAAIAYRARRIMEFQRQEEQLVYSERASNRELVDRIRPTVRKLIEQGDIQISAELNSLDRNNWTGAFATRIILNILGYHPEWEESRQFFSRTAHWITEVWNHDRRQSTNYQERNYELEHDVLHAIARFVLKLPVEEARQISSPLLKATVSNVQEVADFVEGLILAADGSNDDCFWDLWQDLADEAASAPWINRLEEKRPLEEPFIDRIFLCTDWKDDVKHWARLDGHAHRLDALAQRLPPAPSCIFAYVRFLSSIGRQSLPAAFKVVDSLLARSDTARVASEPSFAFHLETLLRSFIYSEPQRIKSSSDLREAILGILDALIVGGSSSAYQMRDYFVTPFGTNVT